MSEFNINKAFSEMDDDYSIERYNEYLNKHIQGVKDAYEWIKENIPEVLYGVENATDKLINYHDSSKYQSDEFLPYARYFYGKETLGNFETIAKKQKIDEDFDYAWLHHIHENKHHWNHWVIIGDYGKLTPLDMPKECIIEMICDHFSFAFTKNNPRELFDWYEKNKDKMVLSDNTREEYENILNLIKSKLNTEDN